MITMAVSIFALPAANAQSQTLKTYAFINASPNPIQVGTETLLHIGISRPLILQAQGWTGITVTVTKPDNTTTTLDNGGPGFKTDSTGGTGTVFVPDQVGTYYLQTNFPAQWFNYTGPDGRGGIISISVYAQASTSEKLPLIVQEEALPFWPGVPLPTEYWTRPIDTQAYEWSTISGSWLDANRRLPAYVPFNDGPETAHVLWARSDTNGGLVGGAIDNWLGVSNIFFEIGDAYEGKFAPRMIIAGKLYYDRFASSDNNHKMVAVDLRTGKELWARTLVDGTGAPVLTPLPVPPGGTITTPVRPVRGQLMYWNTYDMQGVFDYIWVTVGTSWHAFDPATGDWVYTLTNMPSGTITYGPRGEILIYTFNLANGWMTLWNSTNVPASYVSTEYGSMGWGQWRPQGKTINAVGPIIAPSMPLTAGRDALGLPWNASGYMWNKTIPRAVPGGVNFVYPLDRAICTDVITPIPGFVGAATTKITTWGIDLSLGKEGQQLFNKTWQAPASWVEGNQTIIFEAVSPESKDGVFVIGARDNRQHYGFSTETGDYLWVTDPEIYLNWYGLGGIGGERPPQIAYGKLLASGIGGVVYAYDTKNGERLWTYNATDPYGETLFSSNWWLYPVFITEGKIYYGHLEHSPNAPFPRGAPFLALDIETGEEVFRVNGMFRQTLWGGLAIIGDSIIATQDTYDNRIYAIGKGPSATTVTAPDIAVPLGTSVMIRGTVTDISPGTKDDDLALRFPNGVPAVSDESMSEWMLYLYKQFARPAATGVNVTLTVLDPNGNVYDIGTVTSDSTGLFKLLWEPLVPGEYTVIAQFPGSEGYWPSYAETAVGVLEAPVATPGPSPTPAPMTDTYVAGFGIALIIILVAGIVIIVLILRKR
jgi:outer membrane protein assembly factor BamB